MFFSVFMSEVCHPAMRRQAERHLAKNLAALQVRAVRWLRWNAGIAGIRNATSAVMWSM
jgi:hypothetical protein